MPTYEIKFKKAAQKFLNKQDKNQRIRLYKAISMLPDGANIKKLSGYDLYRLRVGNYRILYTIDNKIYIINIENIDNRGQVYNSL